MQAFSGSEPPPRNHHQQQGYYGTYEAFTVHHKARRLAAVAAYLRNILLPPSPLPSSPTTLTSSSGPAPAASPVLPPRTPEQAGAVVEALLTGPLAKDLEEVGIAVEDVRGALAGTKGGAGMATVAVSPKLFGAGPEVGAGPVAIVEPLRLHYSHEAAAAAHQHYRRILDGPFGYAPTDDALSLWLGPSLTASSMLAAVWWLTAAAEEKGGLPPLLAALVVGPAGLLLGTGRGRVVLQSLYVTVLAGLICLVMYHWGNEISSWCVGSPFVSVSAAARLMITRSHTDPDPRLHSHRTHHHHHHPKNPGVSTPSAKSAASSSMRSASPPTPPWRACGSCAGSTRCTGTPQKACSASNAPWMWWVCCRRRTP